MSYFGRRRPERIARTIEVRGAVQGVGFRPYVHRLAAACRLAGEVRNTPTGVQIIVEGECPAVDEFLDRLTPEAPPLARIEEVLVKSLPQRGYAGFAVEASTGGDRAEGLTTAVMADSATCPDCLRELFDVEDRRYRYPFLNCTNCGPRFSIVADVPYDRSRTTMAGFTMCPECRAEYDDPHDRRFHAEPNACGRCGPRLRLTGGVVEAEGDDALRAAAGLLERGAVVAVKGIGGYHLACSALDEGAVRALRDRKDRDTRPFAVMVPYIEAAERYGHISIQARELLLSTMAPIVLAPQKENSLAPSVAPDLDTYGLFLPYTPLHHLLLDGCDRPLVMTSGNLTDEPIAYRDADALARLDGIADAFLVHDRPIHARVDDSVAICLGVRPIPVRRSRGYAPLPTRLPADPRWESGRDEAAGSILAFGADLKNTFCITSGADAFLGPHVGDLDNPQTLQSLEEGIEHLTRLQKLEPRLVARDLHPSYLSGRFAEEYASARSLPVVTVQHHEAHIAAVMAEHGRVAPVVGVAFDGFGYGADGGIWGGEIITGDAAYFRRAGHLDPFPLPGGDAAAREPWRVAVALLDLVLASHTGGGNAEAGSTADRDATDSWRDRELERVLATLPAGSGFQKLPWQAVLEAARKGVNTPVTSSAGRLFDAVSALLGYRLVSAYEAQAAMLLEAAARRALAEAPRTGVSAPLPTSSGSQLAGGAFPEAATGSACDPLRLPTTFLIEDVLSSLSRGVPRNAIALRFHRLLADTVAATVELLARRHSLDAVVLGGGVFQNTLLLELLESRLEGVGLRVLTAREIPSNDGGIALGQAYIAAARQHSG